MQMAPVPALPPGTGTILVSLLDTIKTLLIFRSFLVELHSIYVGELSPEVNDDLLRMAFSQCGTVMYAIHHNRNLSIVALVTLIMSTVQFPSRP